jgi:hypothetical protein
MLCARIADAFAAEFAVRIVPDSLRVAERSRVAALESHFGDEAWTWRCR